MDRISLHRKLVLGIQHVFLGSSFAFIGAIKAVPVKMAAAYLKHLGVSSVQA